MHWKALGLVACLILISVGGSASPGPGDPPMAIVPFKIEAVTGNPRTVIATRLNGAAMPMMVHSNADALQITHAQAARLKVRYLDGHSSGYGIEKSGSVSKLGRDQGVLDSIQIGRAILPDVPVSIFEVPGAGPGMLGLPWLQDNRIIVDYAQRSVVVRPTRAYASKMRGRLLTKGYVPVPMVKDEHGPYSIQVSINGTARQMAINTAGDTVIDKNFAEAAKLSSGPKVAEAGGPTGAVLPVFRLMPITVDINGWRSKPLENLTTFDMSAYRGNKKNASPQNGGALGIGLLVASSAVVDFGGRVLFIRQ